MFNRPPTHENPDSPSQIRYIAREAQLPVFAQAFFGKTLDLQGPVDEDDLLADMKAVGRSDCIGRAAPGFCASAFSQSPGVVSVNVV
jgi:hypothetical protein